LTIGGFAEVQGIGDADVAAIERWREEERLRVKSKQNRLLQERADIQSRHFFDAFGRAVPNPPQRRSKRSGAWRVSLHE
jgi:hypothetical protein